MNGTYDILISVFGDRAASMLALMVFLAVAVLAFGIMAAVHARSSVKRRAAGIADYSGEREAIDKNSLRGSSVKAVQRLLDYTTKHYSADDSRRRQGAAPPADPGRHLRSARGRLLLPRAHRAGGRARGRRVHVRCRCS